MYRVKSYFASAAPRGSVWLSRVLLPENKSSGPAFAMRHCTADLLLCGYLWQEANLGLEMKLEISNAKSLSLFTWYAWMATRSSTSEFPSPRLDLRIWQRWIIESHSNFLHLWRIHDHCCLSSIVEQHEIHEPDCARKIRPPDAPTVAPTACSSSSNTSTWKKLLIFIPF